MLSNAFAKFKYMISTDFLLSKVLVTSSMNSSKFVRHDLFFVNPCWLSLIKENLFKWFKIQSLVIDLIILQTKLVKLIGL